jgi:hypothetical protein
MLKANSSGTSAARACRRPLRAATSPAVCVFSTRITVYSSESTTLHVVCERKPVMLKRLILPVLLLSSLTLAAPAQEAPPAGGFRGGQGAGMGPGRGVGGTVTAVTGTTITIKTEDGDTYQILTSANSHIMRRVDRQPEPVKIADIHVGDAVMAGGEIDAKARTVGAVFVMVLTPEQAARQNLDRRRGDRHQGSRHHNQAPRRSHPDGFGR